MNSLASQQRQKRKDDKAKYHVTSFAKPTKKGNTTI